MSDSTHGRRTALVIACAIGLALAVPESAAGQGAAAEGWWEWALRDLAAEGALGALDGAELDAALGLHLRDRRFDRRDRRLDRRDRRLDRRDRRLDRRERRFHRDRRNPWRGRAGHRFDSRRGAPAFCRDGSGHPVFGRSWCHRMGFGTDFGWRRGSWLEEIIFRTLPGQRRPHRHGTRGGFLRLDEAGVVELLGEAALRRLLREAGLAPRRGGITGRWMRLDGGGGVLQLRTDGDPLAELTDLQGDGRVDAGLLAERLRR